ncbi:MAG: N-acetylmuramoyl-L-alanine amidase [Syntrophothermus sp.]
MQFGRYQCRWRQGPNQWAMVVMIAAGVLFGGVFANNGEALAQPPVLNVVYPPADRKVVDAQTFYVFGSTDPEATLRINGAPVDLEPNGAFLTMVTVPFGSSTVTVEAAKGGETARVTRTVTFPAPWTTSPVSPVTIENGRSRPAKNQVLQPGDVLKVFMKGSPGGKATFSIGNFKVNLPMVESTEYVERDSGEALFGDGTRTTLIRDVKGLYSGTYVVQPGDVVNSAIIGFKLVMPNGETATAVAPGRVTFESGAIPQIAEIVEEPGIVRTGPSMARTMHLPKGIRLWVAGQDGDFLKVRLALGVAGWVAAKQLKMLPPGTPVPYSSISSFRTIAMADRTQIRLYLSERLPFRVEQSTDPNRLILTVYGAAAATESILYDPADKLIREIKWSQPATDIYQLQIDLNVKQQWGFDCYYDKTELVLEVKKPPAQRSLGGPLAGKTIVVDAGHGGTENGAIGPTLLMEKEVNLGIALELRGLLEKAGARVVMTRVNDTTMELPDRVKIVTENRGDLLVSIHNNALSDGFNPWEVHGTSTYYYYPQSLPLARAIQRSLVEALKLPDYAVFYRNLAVARVTQMPAVLIEVAFMINPREEALLAKPEFRQKAAVAILKGIEDFFDLAAGSGVNDANGRNR